MKVFEMALFLASIGYHTEDLIGYSDEEIKTAYMLETAET